MDICKKAWPHVSNICHASQQRSSSYGAYIQQFGYALDPSDSPESSSSDGAFASPRTSPKIAPAAKRPYFED